MKQLNKILAFALVAICLAACQKEQPAPSDNPSGGDNPAVADTLHGVALILNEGGWGANEASISLLLNDTTGEMINDWFSMKNGRGLGDVAQDMVAYGSKIYVTVWGSKSIEVIDRNTSRSKHIDLGNREPRYMATHDGKVYITCYEPNSVIRLDTTTLQIEASCTLGNYNPEGIAIVGGKIFVASQKMGNSDGSYSFDNKVYVIDVASFANPTTVTVGINPDKVLALNNQYVVVNCFGEYVPSTYSYVNPKVAVINANSLEVTLYDQELQDMTVYNGSVYGFRSSYGSNMYFTLSGSPTNFTFVSSFMDSGIDPYRININPSNGDEYLTTTGGYTTNGDVLFISNDRTRSWSSQVGMLPSKVVFL